MPGHIPLTTLVPELILLAGGCIVLLLGVATRPEHRRWTPWLTLAALVGAAGVVLFDVFLASQSNQRVAAGSGLQFGPLATFVRIAALELGILLTLVNWSAGRREERGEFLALMLFSLVGLLLVAPANNLFVLFLALELVSLPTYVLIVLSRPANAGLEAGTKYFFLGALSAGLMAYGFSFLYGVAGTASLDGVALAVTRALADGGSLRSGLAMVGVALVLAGLLFKVAAVPMHFYIADVYQGAASPVAGLLGFVPKLAGFVAIFKLIGLTGFWQAGPHALYWLLWLIAAASMTAGNVLALRQTNLKRLLAYSGIAHTGYMLVGVLAGPQAGDVAASGDISVLGNGLAGVLYYTVIYGLTNLAAFAVLGILRTRGGPCETLRNVAGLLRREPGLAVLLSLAMFTLMGLPPTPGFWGKFALFGSALAAARQNADTWLIVLVVLAVLNTALSAAYYLRVIAAALWYENDQPAYASAPEAQHTGALLCGVLIVYFMFFPTGLLDRGHQATRDLSAPVASVSPEPDAIAGTPDAAP